MNNILGSHRYKIYDINIVRGEADFVYDDHGKEYVDFEAGVWSTCLGHCHPRVNAAIRKQIDQIVHLGYQYNNPVVQGAAERVLEAVHIADGKCTFLSSGSEAVEFGVQGIRKINRQPMLLGLAGAFLGSYGSAGRRSSEEWNFFDWSCCSSCELAECSMDCRYFKEIPFEKIGGFVLEPGNSSGLVKLPPKKLINKLEQVVRDNNGIIMANEITTGLGRTGAWFGYEHYGLKPDIVAMGKHIGNGYPVSAVAMKPDIAERLMDEGLKYGQSHMNDALGCAVATEVINTIKDEDLIKRSAAVGAWFKGMLEHLQARHGCIKEVRGRGLMITMEFVQDKSFSHEKIHRRLVEGGFLVGNLSIYNTIRFYPPLVIKESAIESLTQWLDEILP